MGNNEHSWGWDLGRNKIYHDSKNQPGKAYPANLRNDDSFVVPDKFLGKSKEGLVHLHYVTKPSDVRRMTVWSLLLMG